MKDLEKITIHSTTGNSFLFQNSTNKNAQAQRKQTILIVEDCVEQGATLKLFLYPFFCKTVVMPNVEAALEYLVEYAYEVVLILSDINLPGISELEFVKKVRSNSNFNRIPIIIQSSENEEELQSGVALGANGYIQKPYTKEVLYAAIKKLDIEIAKEPLKEF